MLELFGADTGNSRRAAIALAEAGLPFVARHIDLRAGEHRSAKFLALNPAGKIPVLVDRTNPDAPFIVTQSGAIGMFAAERGRSDCLLPSEAATRIRTFERYFYFATDVVPLSGVAFAMSKSEQSAARVLETSVVERIEAAERFLEDGPYMAGDRFSLADVAGFTITLAYRDRLDWRADRALVQWFDRVALRPGVQQGLAAFKTDG